ncbi:putative hypothetical protein [Methanococcus vannielii SB]|uniref:DUF2178 domain-containing protein n=1 Tax=Methanococcus vannielii (strain ATCC 35089 / DSM 1224 / JCM 13029 / OCM 148 / SB) TaxID=406327 RepID=A6UP08_METVS|nr:hypothetical protein [Methanococcus vannielii]ABR54230.1 putative hypothetical protein [Methanococcus vannielii SB]
MESKYKTRLILGFLTMLFGIFLEYMFEIDKLITIVLINLGAILVVYNLYYHIKYREIPSKDERIRKTANAGLAYSWVTTFLIITLIFWIDYFKWLEITIQQVIGLIYFVMIISALLFQTYFKKMGDIE